jgi:flagellar biosynthesis protein FlhF
MYLRTYRGSSVRDLLAQAKIELGPDALVLSTRMVSAGGLRGLLGGRVIELVAAAERQVSRNRPSAPSSRHVPVPVLAPENEIAARLCATGLDRSLALEVAAAVPTGRRRAASGAAIRSALAEQLTALAAGAEEYRPVEVFVGPPGVGKTTTIAKIASQERAKHGRRLTLVSADGYRVGAVEQLRLYADIVGSPFKVARNAAELDQVLAETRGPVLVDTAGRTPRDGVAQDLFTVLRGRRDVRTHLVVSAALGAAEMTRTIDQYRCAEPHRIAFSRLDEAETLSPLVGLLRAQQLPVSYLGTGQRVPEDLDRATGALLAALALGESPCQAARPA